MFKLTAIICFLSIGSNNLDLCMKAELPLTFETHAECVETGKEIATYMHEDLINKNIAMQLACEESKYQDANFFRAPI